MVLPRLSSELAAFVPQHPKMLSSARPRESGDPVLGPWIPAFAGMSGVCFAVSAISLKFSHHLASWHALRDRRQPISIRVPSKESKPMKPGLRPGAYRVNRITIGPERTISFMGEDARTYATPAMVRSGPMVMRLPREAPGRRP